MKEIKPLELNLINNSNQESNSNPKQPSLKYQDRPVKVGGLVCNKNAPVLR